MYISIPSDRVEYARNDKRLQTSEDMAAETSFHKANGNYRVKGRWFNEDGRQFPGSEFGYMKCRRPCVETDENRWKRIAGENAIHNSIVVREQVLEIEYLDAVAKCGCGKTGGTCGVHGKRPPRTFRGDVWGVPKPESWKAVRDQENRFHERL